MKNFLTVKIPRGLPRGGFNFKKIKIALKAAAVIAIVSCLLMAHDASGWYPAKYTESAHGGSATGVKRRIGTLTADYARGNCAHCHEQHGSVGGQVESGGPYGFGLFAQNNPGSQADNFCLQCHRQTGSIQEGGIANFTYSKNFGGGTETFSSIYEAFNPTSGATRSSHNLSDLVAHAATIGGFSGHTNGCVACHNPHTAQRNFGTVVVNPSLGGVPTAIRRPLDYETRGPNLWGDEDAATSGYNERMIDATGRYQAPYYKGAVSNRFEPANDTTSDGSNLPNFNNFCRGPCHGGQVYSTERTRNLVEIDWSTSGDRHGKVHVGSGLGVTVAPYGNETYNYVLSCTDCHEPHGSPNEWLLRTCVNGKDNIVVAGSGQWLDFCTACHSVDQHQPTWDSTTNCGGEPCHGHGFIF